MKTPIRFLFTLLCAAVASLQIVHASTLTVTNTSDSGVGSLRGVLASALDGDTIDFAVTGTITLTSGQLEVGKSIMINGPGANVLAVDGNNSSTVFHITSGSTVTISGLTIRNGSSADFGGGIYNDHATLTINNSTLSGNSAPLNSGGGIYNSGAAGSATLTINNSTLSGNSASAGGGGIFNGKGTLTIGDTILNAGSSGANISKVGGTVMSLGYNLSSDDESTLLNQSTDQNSTNPMLAPLANNGGPTFTHALLAGSPAIDKGKNFTTATTDQRGFFRTFDNFSIPNATGGDGTDIGAFEVQATVCPEPQGLWKNNPAAWPASALPMTLGSQTYNQTELLTILQTPIKGDASLILADQLIAAKLNIANANGTPVASTTADADSLLSGFNGKLPYHVKSSTSTGQAMVNDANVLDSYNNGVMTPGCTP